MKRTTALSLVVVLCLSAVALGGCYRQELPENQKILSHSESSSASTEGSQDTPLAGATALEATVKMGAGELTIERGGSDALSAEYVSDPDSLAPSVTYDVDAAGTGQLLVDQGDWDGNIFSDMENRWTLRLSDAVPLDLSVDLGAGESDLLLGGLDLRTLTMNMGAGETTVDFSGDWESDVDARLQAGVGQLTLKLPADVGVRVDLHRSGIGDVVADAGFTQSDGVYQNRTYGETSATIEVSVQRGIGEVRLETAR